MNSVLGLLSAGLYAAGVALLAAAAAVYKKNGLYEYYCLMHGKPVRIKREDRTAGKHRERGMTAGESEKKDDRGIENAADRTPKEITREKYEAGTQVLSGSSDTTILGKKANAAGKTETVRTVQGERIWGKPTARFRVTMSEVVVHTDKTIRTRAKGEKDEV